ncbi:GDCCVxC domain-containing (seleno)protein [Rhizorhapis sp. SPR117]|uniref:GDCCVxC domain-containing (seleno)protein n=1 Tax=Rhizorhapis sp. SPR117 TaxID=2912611 RepID=UPI00403E5F8A
MTAVERAEPGRRHGALLRPKHGDCCVYCSYCTTPCPPVQLEQKDSSCCAGSSAGNRRAD